MTVWNLGACGELVAYGVDCCVIMTTGFVGLGYLISASICLSLLKKKKKMDKKGGKRNRKNGRKCFQKNEEEMRLD